jgi:hypothetical protein
MGLHPVINNLVRHDQTEDRSPSAQGRKKKPESLRSANETISANPDQGSMTLRHGGRSARNQHLQIGRSGQENIARGGGHPNRVEFVQSAVNGKFSFQLELESQDPAEGVEDDTNYDLKAYKESQSQIDDIDAIGMEKINHSSGHSREKYDIHGDDLSSGHGGVLLKNPGPKINKVLVPKIKNSREEDSHQAVFVHSLLQTSSSPERFL